MNEYNLDLKNKLNFILIAGPCIIEDKKTTFKIASHIKNICEKLDIKYILKGSYRKANRSRIDSFTGIGDKKALRILNEIGSELNIPTTTDVHSVEEVKIASKYVDILQIPAFLSRQTDLLVAAAKTKKIINIKKGQFSSPLSMKYATEKVKKNGNDNILLTDRGTTFGYEDLILDMRSIPIMKKFALVIIDVTHSLQRPNQISGVTSGQPEFIETLSMAAIAAGADGLFIETHPNPSIAKSDGSNMLHLDKIESLLKKLIKIKKAI